MGETPPTFGNVAGLVLSRPCEVLILDPRHPALVLTVVEVFGGFHCGVVSMVGVGVCGRDLEYC